MAAVRQAGPEVIILPNEYRVAALAGSAAARLVAEGQTVAVIPARSPLQALAAMTVHDPSRPFDADLAAMSQAAAGMRYGSVIRRGDSLAGLVADEVAVTGADAAQVAIGVARALMAGGAEVVTLMAAEGDAALARAVAGYLHEAWPEAEVACYDGGPAPLLIGVE
jgi:dihydroxyacetone kinase-like predicted kinase